MNRFPLSNKYLTVVLSALLALLLASSSLAQALSIFETPDDKDHTIIQAIASAKKSVDVEVYEISDADVINALILKAKEGATVRVILNPKNAEGKDTNKPYAAQLTTEGVSVKYSRTITPGGGQHYDETHFRFDHSKIILADEGTPNPKALVMTINLGPGYLGKPSKEGISLNFGLVDTKVADNTYLEDIFDCDWNATPAPKPIATDLLISPLNSRTELISQIKNAKKSFHFFNQELGDKLLIAALVSAARRGVEVKGLVSPNLVKQKNIQGIKDAGGEILALADPYEHAKAAIADGKVSYVGSINYTKSSFDENREVGILTDQQDIATALEGYFFKFWPQGQQITTQ